jgi:dTDP-4-amino-4,6-dideoxygalactose transaminase
LNQEFTVSLSRALTVPGGVSLASYRASIHCALELLELEKGDGVLISALAPKQYLQVIESRGLVALVADVDPERPLLSSNSLQHQLASGAKAIVLYYSLGSMPAGDDIFQLGVPVIEDITQAVGGVWGDQPCGSRGRVGVLSLDPGGLITTGCGGMVFSRDRRSARTLKDIAGQGFYDQLLPDMNAALGITQVRELQRFLDKRFEMAQVFREALLRSRHSPLFNDDEDGEYVNFSFPILVKDGRLEVMQYANKKGIQSEPAFKDAIVAVAGSKEGNHSLDGSSSSGLDSSEGREIDTVSQFPNARELLWRCLLFPLYPSLARKDVQLICKVLSTLP